MAGAVTFASIAAGNSLVASFASATGVGGFGARGSSASANRLQFASTDQADLLAQVQADRASPKPGKWGGWAEAFGSTSTIGASGGVTGLNATIGGGTFGIDYQFTPDLTLGVGLGYAHTDTNLEGSAASGTTSTLSTALYGSYRFDAEYVAGTLGYAYNLNDTKRDVAVVGVGTQIAKASSHANQFLSGVEYGRDIGEYHGITLTPFGSLQAVVIRQSAFSESGAGVFDLSVASDTSSSLRSILGLQGSRRFALSDSLAMDTRARLGWAHELLNESRAATAQFASSSGSSFSIASPKPLRDSAVLSLGVGVPIGSESRFYTRYDGDISLKDNAHTLTVGISFAL